MTKKELKKYIEQNITMHNNKKILSEKAYNDFVMNKIFSEEDIEIICEILSKENIEIVENGISDENNELNIRELSNINSMQLYLDEIGKLKLLSPEEEYNLVVKAKNGNEKARKEFLERNLRLVVSIAKKTPSPSNYQLQDKIQDGNIGLIKALDKYNPNQGYKFSTYATWWIRQSITRGMSEKIDAIRKPIHYQENLSKIKKYISKIEARTSRKPSYEEISEATGLKVSTVKNIMITNKDYVSLNSYISKEKDSKVEDFVADDTNFMQDIEDKTMNDFIAKELNDMYISDLDLTKNEIDILIDFGKQMGILIKEYNKRNKYIKKLNSSSFIYDTIIMNLKEYESEIKNEIKSLKYDFDDNDTTLKYFSYNNNGVSRYSLYAKKIKIKNDEIKEINSVINNIGDYLMQEKSIYFGNVANIIKNIKSENELEFQKYIESLKKINKEHEENMTSIEKKTNILEINNKVNNIEKRKEINKHLEDIEKCYMGIIRNTLYNNYLDNSIVNHAINIINKECKLNNNQNINLILSGFSVKEIEKKWMEKLVLLIQQKNILNFNQLTRIIRYYNMRLNSDELSLDKFNKNYLENYENYKTLLMDLRTKDILEKRLSVTSETYTLDKIAFDYGITKERVRQIADGAIRKLKVRLNKKGMYTEKEESKYIKKK